MKLSTKLGLVVGCAALGTLLIIVLALQNIRASMLADRHEQINMVLELAKKQVGVFVAEEKAGSLTRDEAQKRARQALRGLRNGDDYLFARDFHGMLLVHPDPSREGKSDPGSKLPDGRTTLQAYLDALKNTDLAIVEIMTKKPKSDSVVPKLNGVAEIPEWEWMIGFGLFIDDIEKDYRNVAIRFGVIGLVVFAIVLVAAFLMSRGIYRALGGEPEQAAAVARAIARGDLSQHIDHAGGGRQPDGIDATDAVAIAADHSEHPAECGQGRDCLGGPLRADGSDQSIREAGIGCGFVNRCGNRGTGGQCRSHFAEFAPDREQRDACHATGRSRRTTRTSRQ